MFRILTIGLFISLWGDVLAQFPQRISGPISTRKGYKLKEGDTLMLGRGSHYDGSFLYIKSGLMPHTAVDRLEDNRASSDATIKNFQTVTLGGTKKTYAAIKAGTLYAAFADLEAAIDAKEIIGVNKYEFGKPRPRQQIADKAETIKPANVPDSGALGRLKQLYIDGDLTKEEYDRRKAELQGGGSSTASTNNPDNGRSVAVSSNEATTYSLKPYSENVQFKVLSVSGSKVKQRVTISFQLLTQLPNQLVSINTYGCNYIGLPESSAYDSEGKQYASGYYALGNQGDDRSVENKLPTGIPLTGSITFINILPSVKALSFVNFPMSNKNLDGGQGCEGGSIELRNLKIAWKE